MTVDMGPAYTGPYTYTRLFNAAGVQLAIGNYGSEPELDMFVLPASGTFYIGVSSDNNTGYNPAMAHSGSDGDYTGDYTMTATLVSGGGTSLAGTTAPAATSTQPALTPASDPGDTLTTATVLGLAEDSKLAVNQKIGDGAGGANDVDLYSFAGTAGDLVTVDLGPANTNPYPVARLFDASGNQLAVGTYSQEPELNMFVLPASGTYYIGVSSWSDTSYNPTKSGSGSGGGYTGAYTMTVTRQALTGATATAGVGTPARSALASANPGQVITLTGSGLRANDQVVFETVNYNSSAVGWTAVNPISVSSDGTSLQVVVPDSAVSGTVRLARESVGLFLQVVPTVSNVDESSSAYHADGLTVEGSGLIEAGTTINFGGQSLADDGPSSGPDVVYDYANGSDRADGLVNLTVPNGVPYGPISVTTFGGTSNPFAETFTAIEGTATSGTPTNAAIASANIGQAITLDGSRFTLSTAVAFSAIDYNGNRYEHVVKPIAIAPDGSKLIVVVPDDAMTGPVSVVGDQLNTAALLQVVPLVTYADFQSVAGDGSSAAPRSAASASSRAPAPTPSAPRPSPTPRSIPART